MSAGQREVDHGYASRIAVWGVTGSGKTTLSQRLGAALGLEVIQLDAIRHARGWDSVDWPEFRTRLGAELDAAANGWICEGGYSRVMDVYLSQLDTLIWLRLPLRVTFSRLVRRTIQRSVTRQPLYGPEGPRESIRQALLSKDSLLLYSLSTHRAVTRQRRDRIDQLPASVRVHELRSLRAVEEFLAPIEARARNPESAREGERGWS